MERQRRVTGRKYLDRRTGATHTEGDNGKNQGGTYETPKNVSFVNPYFYMSSIDARIAEYLLEIGVAFAYDYFDQAGGPAAPHMKVLLPNFAPPFTLPDYRVVIMVQSDFWGSLPGVINQNALAEALLQTDGWKAVVWTSAEIQGFPGVASLFQRDLPEVVTGPFKGQEVPSPYGRPNTWNRRRSILRGLGLIRSKHHGPKKIEDISSGTDNNRTRSHRIADSIVDNSRRRRRGIKTGEDTKHA